MSAFSAAYPRQRAQGIFGGLALAAGLLWQTPGLPVDTGDRDGSAQFYYDHHVANLQVPVEWTGDTATCTAGTTSQAFIDATIGMVNYYRRMAGLPQVVNHAPDNAAAQEAALMFRANGMLSHSPPASWECYTVAGAQAAASSNIAMAHGTMAVFLYAWGPGIPSVGHRRWLLYPPRIAMGTGSTPNSNALHVFGPAGNRPATPVAVTWPPAGFVPYPVVFPYWSFSLNSDPDASYTAADVAMLHNGSPVPVTIVSTNGQFGDRTIVWEPQLPAFAPGMTDMVLDITVSGIANSSITQRSYQVTVFDPATADTVIFKDAFQTD